MTSDPSMPSVQGSLYTYAFGDTSFAVDASKAGRIVTFSFAGKNILTAPKNSNDSLCGSIFWTSPQSDWNWPPPAAIDSDPYTPTWTGGTLVLASATAGALGLAVTKRFSVDAGAGVVTIDYGIENKGGQARSVAPWEISRVAAGGLTFFPIGDSGPRKGAQDLLTLRIQDGVAWFAYDAATITNDQKVFADGHEGWIAHVDGDLLLVKAWNDIAAHQAAPGEAEIEIYADAAHTYVEVENQGAYTNLAPGASLTWTVRWFLRKLDASLSAQAGSSALLTLVRGLLGA